MCGNSEEINLQCESEVRGGQGWNKDGSWDSQLIHNRFVELSRPRLWEGVLGKGGVNSVGLSQGLTSGWGEDQRE